MANVTTVVETHELVDFEDGSTLRVVVQSCSELGNAARPGLQVMYLGNIVNYEPLQVARWAYQARKTGQEALLLADHSWDVYPDRFVRNSLVVAEPPRARIEMKTRSRAKPLVREYALPFTLDAE